MAGGYRRIVTGWDADGRSRVASDGRVATAALGIIDLWKTDAVPAPLTAESDAGSGSPLLEPPPGGSIFRLFEIPPARGVRVFRCSGSDISVPPTGSCLASRIPYPTSLEPF